MVGIRIENLRKTYDGKTEVLRGVDIDIRPGEFLVLVGPSGCGKSTLLRLIAGLEEVSSGEIWIGDRRVSGLSPAERNLAMVFQDYALYPHMTVRENLSFGLKVRGVPRAELDEQVRTVASLLKIEALLDRKPSALSGGQRQRVAIGRAIARKPLAFLFDEPLSNLDAQLRIQTRVELAALHRRLSTTTIYVTHDQTEAMTLADRIVILDQGRVQQIGEPLELFHHPANRFVASFIGNPGMNFLEGRWNPQMGFSAGGLAISPQGWSAPQIPEGEVVLGVRPEGIRIAGCGIDCDAKAVVIAVEPLGHETLIAVEIVPSVSTLIRATGDVAHQVRAGERVPIALNRGALRWFSLRDGRSIG